MYVGASGQTVVNKHVWIGVCFEGMFGGMFGSMTFRGMFGGMFHSTGLWTKGTLWGYVSGYILRYVSRYRGVKHAPFQEFLTPN